MAAPERNTSLALSLLAIVAGMAMLAYASVPLYRIFCRATGFGGTAQATTLKASHVVERDIEVRFDANVNPQLLWNFRPVQLSVHVKPGEQKTIAYIATSQDARTTKGTATFNITPVKAGQYFNKIQCFCFTEQTLQAGETKRLPVTFFIDPAMAGDHALDEVHTITLSYTFFPVK